MANEIPVIPPDMRKVYLRLKRWRSSHARRVPIPDSLWAAAGELARAHLQQVSNDVPGVTSPSFEGFPFFPNPFEFVVAEHKLSPASPYPDVHPS
jgi:hypothetical protein